MGMFSKLRAVGRSKDTTIAKAVLAPSVLTMAADGSIDRSEIAQLSNVCSFSPIFVQFDASEIEKMIINILDDFKARSIGPVMADSVAALSPALRETSMCFAMRIALADGQFDDSEKAAVANTASLMNLSQESFDKIVDVVAMMQRPAAA